MDNKMDAKVCLRAAELVEQGHCKNRPAADQFGSTVWPDDESAVAWCATGALAKAHTEIYGVTAYCQDDVWEPFRKRISRAAGLARDEMGLRTFDACNSVPEWNNKPRTKPTQVARFLRLLAEKLQ